MYMCFESRLPFESRYVPGYGLVLHMASFAAHLAMIPDGESPSTSHVMSQSLIAVTDNASVFRIMPTQP